MSKMRCRVHHLDLERNMTQWGFRWQCPADGCTVACWEGGTSTPADQETREARQRCHQALNPLWRSKSHFRSRRKAYVWLSRQMSLSPAKCHVGMFNLKQCNEMLLYLEELGVLAPPLKEA